jgi:ubiquinone/menaquinone biosynthesis C-methylase UbiE
MSNRGDRIPPELWDEKQLLTRCEYYKEFLEGEIGPSYKKALGLLKPEPNKMILDIGCGRGEIVKECAKVTDWAVGVDYSFAAVKISKNYVGAGNIVRASATHLPFKNEVFDDIAMLGFINHLSEKDLIMCLQESKRVLRADGRMLITTPNMLGVALFHALGSAYRLLLRRQKVPIRPEYFDSSLRLNSKNYLSLRRILSECGFKPKIWFDAWLEGNAARIVCKILFFVGPLYCIAEKEEH